jgi:uncharacterized damage-inducible protein DinB
MAVQEKIRETHRIAGQLRLLYEGPSWLGPTLKDLIVDVDEKRARARPLSHAHTIWELVLHITAWLRVSRDRLSATITRDPDEAENWPPMNGAWQDAISSLEVELYALEKAILEFPEARLAEAAPANEPQTFYLLLHGVIQHSAYHGGQIALLKKA